MYSDIKHFNGLNSLRFIAAFLVLIHHAEQIRLKYGMFNLKQISLFNNGGVAVSFFFVLSGFLITYLLILEKTSQDNNEYERFLQKILETPNEEIEIDAQTIKHLEEEFTRNMNDYLTNSRNDYQSYISELNNHKDKFVL